ncbi:uncharacterized protein AB675_8736 [Cyphellophora attinorum]|uniref:Uncharacterized protein n=1 Tax=Cyphellophora attinorum TaxID=1664694 RepID=A0A0N0NR58_9EURO|nr:uncharacterized protein AB675_8736 [Phialophora attinorum]KPI44449.1 hypothetical protein AB675_8736 [Phialophora attinorum]
MPQDVLEEVRQRELDHALRNYRSARNAFRSDRSVNDMGTVPTAAALRQYWTEDDHTPENERTRLIHTWAERHRRERQQRLQGRHMDASSDAVSSDPAAKPSSLSDATALKDRIRNTIRYLSKLRDARPEDGLNLAREMDLDVLYECELAHTPNDLPMLAESLPKSEPTSWLTAGSTWHGLQCTAREFRPSYPTVSSSLRMARHREHFGRSITRRGLVDAQNAATTLMSDTDSGSMDPDRYSSSLMRDLDGRWGFATSQDPEILAPTSLARPHRQSAENRKGEIEHWPVTVTLHSVDRQRMLVEGTMRASQIPYRSSTGGKSMESYFEGEIIDFRQHSLETDPQRGYKVGGLDTDARYWSRLGPFKEAIEKQAQGSRWDSSVWEDKLKTGDAKYWDILKAEEQASRELEADRVMMRCLGNQKWLQEKLGTEWVLMRWKERCFVEPILKQAYKQVTTETSSGLESDSMHPTWGLTISGFYYIALHRQSGSIEGLYCDPGSQPYQSLKMAPEDMHLPAAKDGEKSSPRHGQPAAIKRWFPAVDFR